MTTTRAALVWPQVLLYTGTGLLKLAKTPQQLHDDLGFHWAGRFPVWSVRAIASAELAAAAALTGHALTGRGRRLARVASGGLVLLQVGAVTVNLSDRDPKPVPLNLGALALAVASTRRAV